MLDIHSIANSHESEDRKRKSFELYRELSELEKQSPSFIAMLGGDPRLYDLVNPELVAALKDAAQKAFFMYPSASGFLDRFKSAVSNFEKDKRGVEYQPQNIIPTTGLAAALYLLQSAILRAGDEIALFSPNHYFYGPSNQTEFLGASLLSIRTYEEDGWLPRAEDLKKVISPKTRLLMLVNPQNPLGVVYPEKTLKEICDVAAEFSLPIVSDEIYGLITNDGVVSHSTPRYSGENLVLTLSGMSKLFFATGLRVGYICIHGGTEKNRPVIESLRKVASLYGQTSSSIATPVLAAAVEMYTNRLASVDSWIRELQRRRDFAVREIQNIEGFSMVTPTGALYTFPKATVPRQFGDEFAFLHSLAKEEKVGMLPGSMFGDGGEGHIRGLILPDTPIQAEAYERVRKFLKNHNN